MLQFIRERAHGFFAWVMLIVIGVPFALWGIQNYIDTGSEQPAAVVGDHEIFDKDVNRAYEQTLAGLVGVADYDEKQVRQEALEKLVRDELIYDAAENESLTISDDDIRGYVQSMPYFQTDGKFDKEKYRSLLSAQNMTPNQFAAQIRKALLMEQFQNGVVESAFVTPDQVDLLMRLRNQERLVEYVKIPLKPVEKEFPDAEIETYYNDHIQEFQNPEQVSIEYVVLDLNDIAKGITVTDDELRHLYDEQKAGLGTEERRKFSHILIPVDPKDANAEQAAKVKADQIRERLAHGEDFSAVAAETSADAGSAKRGGDLGYLTKPGMEESFGKALTDAAYGLKANTWSEPVKSSYGYHIVKLTELVPAKIKTFEEARDELRKTHQHNAAESKFYELGQTLTEQAYEHPDSLEAAAGKLNLKIEKTGLFSRDKGDGIASESVVRTAAFSDEVLNGRNSDPLELGAERAVVLRVKEHTPASNIALADVRGLIRDKLKDQLARKDALEKAKAMTGRVKEGAVLKEVAKAGGFEWVQPEAFRRGSEKLPAELVQAAFKVGRPVEGKPLAEVVSLGNGEALVFNLISVKEGAPSESISKDRDVARDFLSRNEGQREFNALLAQLRKKADVKLKPAS